MLDYRLVLAQNLRSARRALDLSQEALASVTEIDRTYISGIERGRRNPSLTTIAKLAHHLGITPAVLLTPIAHDGGGTNDSSLKRPVGPCP